MAEPSPPAMGGHPFDDAFAVMKSMQAELNQLKYDVQEERHLRAKEVGELQREVRHLRSQLEQALMDLSVANERVTNALTSETSLRGRALEMLRTEVADAIKRASEVEHLKTVQATQFGKLAAELKLERSERQAAQTTLDAMLNAEVQTRTEEGAGHAKDMAQFRRQWEATVMQDRELFALLVKDVQAAGDLLAGNVAKETNPRLSADVQSVTTAAPNSPDNMQLLDVGSRPCSSP